MPYINIRLGTRLADEQRRKLHAQITALMTDIMGKRRAVTVVHIEESPAPQWSIAAQSVKPDAPVAAYVDIKITQGTNTPQEKAEMIASTMQVLREHVGEMQEACYVVIDELPADSWGYNGQTQAARAAARQTRAAATSEFN